MQREAKLLILGSGPAGLTAAIYAGRAGLQPIVLAGGLPGGLLTQTSFIENFPGFPEPIEGFELMERMRAQAEHCGAEVLYDTAASVRLQGQGGLHWVKLTSGDSIAAKALIIATGAKPRELGIAGEADFKAKGISYCATCDGPFYRGRAVAVAGGGDSALEEALFLSAIASKVTLIHRRSQFRASQTMVSRVLANSKIEVAWNTVIASLHGNEKGMLKSLTLRDTGSGAERNLECDGLFVAIGHVPDTVLFKDQLELEDGCIRLADPMKTATAIPGVFAAGDCVDSSYRQAITAAAMGCRAAIDANRWISET